jgi:hypothetical protein
MRNVGRRHCIIVGNWMTLEILEGRRQRLERAFAGLEKTEDHQVQRERKYNHDLDDSDRMQQTTVLDARHQSISSQSILIRGPVA